MKNHVRILALALSLLLALALFGGCGKTESSSASSPAPATAAPTEAPAQETEAPTEEVPAQEGVAYPLTDGAPIELTMWLKNSGKPPSFKTISDITEFECLSVAEEKTGVVVDYQTVSDEAAQELFGTMIASGDWCDMIAHAISYYPGGMSAAYEGDVLIDLSEHIQDWSPNYYSYITSNADAWAGTTLDDGEIVGYYTFSDITMPSWGLAIRSDWLADLSLESPTTVDEMHDVLTAFKSEYGCSDAFQLTEMGQPGSGVVSAFGVSGFMIRGMEAHSHLFMNDAGQVTSSFVENGYRDYLANMHQWMTEGLVSSDFASLTWMSFMPDNMGKVLSGNSGIFYTTANMLADYAAAAADGKFTATGISDPTLEKGDTTHFTSTRTYKIDESLSISTACAEENVEYAMKWIDWWYGEDGRMLKNYGEEGLVWEYDASGEAVFTDEIWKNENYPQYSYTQISSVYILSAAIPCGVNLEKRLFCFYDDNTVASLDAWSAADGANLLPAISLTPEETEAVSQKLADVETYASENVTKFITGDRGLEEWDAFVTEVKGIGLDDVLAVYQAALDRYNAKADAFSA